MVSSSAHWPRSNRCTWQPIAPAARPAPCAMRAFAQQVGDGVRVSGWPSPRATEHGFFFAFQLSFAPGTRDRGSGAALYHKHVRSVRGAGGSPTTSALAGKVKNNVVINAGAGVNGFGIRLLPNSNSTLRANVDGNTVSNVGLDYDILADAAQSRRQGRAKRGWMRRPGTTTLLLPTIVLCRSSRQPRSPNLNRLFASFKNLRNPAEKSNRPVRIRAVAPARQVSFSSASSDRPARDLSGADASGLILAYSATPLETL